MEGPQFSTKAESRLYRQWGVDVIGMTNMPEAKLAREAELCYATVALATDYDCWHETEEAVTVEAILATLHKNVELAKQLLKAVVPALVPDRTCAVSPGAQERAGHRSGSHPGFDETTIESINRSLHGEAERKQVRHG